MNKITQSISGGLCIILLAILITFSSTNAYSESANIKLTDIRHRSGPNYTRIVLDLDGKTEYKYKLLKADPSINKPPRLYVDIMGSRLSGDLSRNIPVNDGLLKNIRAGQNTSSIVRVVMDIESIDDYKVFMLPGPYRIVIDIFGKGAVKRGGPVSTPTTVKTDKLVLPPAKADEKKDVIISSIPKKKAPVGGFSLKRVVIDAGHGGKDPGAVGKRKLYEKDITLKIAKKLKTQLAKRSGARVYLTRSTDVYIPLDERTAIANSKEADLFVSIHVNASPNKKASGVETYYLNYSPDKEAIRVAARENAATAQEMADLEYILRDMMVKSNQDDSVLLASYVQKELSSTLQKRYKGVKSNGAKGALFYVLVNSTMPSVLVEVSFISNPTEAKRLKTDKYLDAIVEGITVGIMRYVNEYGK